MEVIASEFARMAGVSPMSVSKRIKSGTLVRNSAKKLDTDNPVNRAYLERMQTRMKARASVRIIESAATEKETSNPLTAVESQAGRSGDELRRQLAYSPHKSHDMMKMTISELLRTFGTIDNIEKFSKIQRDLSAADEREQRTQEKRTLQIPKDFVVQRIFGYVDQLMNQLLDVPEAVCDQVIAMSLAGGDGVRESVMHILSDSLTKCISGAKEHITGELNALKGKYDRQADMVQEVAQEIERRSEAG